MRSSHFQNEKWMRTSHAHCLLNLNDNHEGSSWFDVYVCINLWSRHLNLFSTPVTVLLLCAVHRANSGFCVWVPLLLRWPQLQTGKLEHPLLLLSSLMRVVFPSPYTPISPLWWAQALHTDCRSFTLCQGKAQFEGGVQASHTLPHQPRWGECRPFTKAA